MPDFIKIAPKLRSPQCCVEILNLMLCPQFELRPDQLMKELSIGHLIQKHMTKPKGAQWVEHSVLVNPPPVENTDDGMC